MMVAAVKTASLTAAWDALYQVMDPEIPVVSVVDLGIVRDVQWQGERLHVKVTPTYSGCPATEFIEDNIRNALERAGYPSPYVERCLAPAWTTEWISDNGRELMQQFGIAPPHRQAQSGGEVAIRWVEKENIRPANAAVACPRCHSTDTQRLSEFGSTACKALYRCKSCLEPFDYFKCI